MRLMRLTVLLLATALSALGLARSASADIIVFAATELGDFGKLDLNTGQYSSIGPSGVVSIVGMGFIGSTLYGVDNNQAGAGSGSGFYTISTATGAATHISTLMFPTGGPLSALGGTTVGSDFFGVTNGNPTQLFGVNSAGVFLGTNTNPTFPADGLVALGPGTSPGDLYVSEHTGNPSTGDELHTIASNGTVSVVGGLNDGMGHGQQAITGLIFGNTLYGIDGQNIYTYTVTPTTVSALLTETAITGLNPANGDFVSAVAGTPSVPEPTSLIMGSIAIVAAGLVYARRRYLTA
jgi:hypothetical protein